MIACAGGQRFSPAQLASIADSVAVADKYVHTALGYNGAAMPVLESYKHEGSLVAALDHHGGTSGAYSGFDRYGRIVDHPWTDGGATNTRDHFSYGYDQGSNRLWRLNEKRNDGSSYDALSEVYTYDKLDRLSNARRGEVTVSSGSATLSHGHLGQDLPAQHSKSRWFCWLFGGRKVGGVPWRDRGLERCPS